MKKTRLLFSSILWCASAGAFAHGFMTMPESRAYLCKQGSNVNCGSIQYEPQSLEAASGFAEKGPHDGHIASASRSVFGELDEQSAQRWAKRGMQAGRNDFTWRFTANHATRSWRYYMTRSDWNPNQKLTRAAFDATPFCSVDGGMRQPPTEVTHTCMVPQRSGYQIILGVWEIGDTPNSFYNVVDVMFGGGAMTAGAPAVLQAAPAVAIVTRQVEPASPRAEMQVEKAPAKAVVKAQAAGSKPHHAASGKHEFVFPDSLGRYQAGTTVLQSKTGLVYECKPWPNSGFCIQWNAGSNQYEPGIGSAWENAWTVRQ